MKEDDPDMDHISHYTYCEALRRVLAVRNQRQKIYADDWRRQADWELLALMKMKMTRLEHFIIARKDEKLYESRQDTLIDTINYGLFMLQNEIDRETQSQFDKKILDGD